MDYYLQMYLQQLLEAGDSSEEGPQRRSIRIVVDNPRSPAFPKSVARSPVGSTKAPHGRSYVAKKQRRSRRSRKFNQTLARLEVTRWQSILLTKAQSQAQEREQAPTQQGRPGEHQGRENTSTLSATLRARFAAPQRPRRRGSMECRPRYPRRQISMEPQSLDGSNHSQVTATAA